MAFRPRRINAFPILAMIVFAAAGCSSAHNTISIAEMEDQSGLDLTEESKSGEPVLRVVGCRTEVCGERVYRVAELILVNPLEVSISYCGYRMDSWDRRPPRGHISPLYMRQRRTDEDAAWQPEDDFWCGTGAGEMLVPPKHAGRFHARFEGAADAVRIELTWWKTSDGASQEKKVWSENVLAKEPAR